MVCYYIYIERNIADPSILMQKVKNTYNQKYSKMIYERNVNSKNDFVLIHECDMQILE
jgi:predicted component of viral defense system (DUF524 family)